MPYFIEKTLWLHDLRKKEFEIIFSQNIKKRFHYSLDLGAGDGFSSKLLASISDKVFATDYNMKRLGKIKSDKIETVICDAELMSFTDKKFDLVFSSNLLEHVISPPLVLKGIYRILTDEGVGVITLPNRTWKVLTMLFYYPNQFGRLADWFIGKGSLMKNNNMSSNVKNTSQPGFIRRNIWPVPHGVSKNNISEIINFGLNHWLQLFYQNGFEVLKIIQNLPLYTGYPFSWDKTILNYLSKVGLSSSNAFIIGKR